jgi:hypothetical protein
MSERALMVAASLAAAASIASAAEWKAVGTTKQGTGYVDASSVAKVGMHRKAWILWNFETEEKTTTYPTVAYRSAKTLTYFDCESQRLGSFMEVLYTEPMGAGSSVKTDSYKFRHDILQDVVPETVGEDFLKFVCRHRLK